jgi:hypothetical protein
MTGAREPQITTKDVVLNLDRKVDELIAGMADLKVIAGTVGTTVETLHDHESRIRALETESAESKGAGRLRRAWWGGVALLVGGSWWLPDIFRHH